MMFKVTIGCTVDAYATMRIKADSVVDLKRKLRHVMDDQTGECGDLDFRPEFGDANDYRLVRVEDEEGKEALHVDELERLADSPLRREKGTVALGRNDRLAVHLPAQEQAWFIGNDNPARWKPGQTVFVQYHPQDQFCTIIDETTDAIL